MHFTVLVFNLLLWALAGDVTTADEFMEAALLSLPPLPPNATFQNIFEHCNANSSNQLSHKQCNTSELACCTTILLNECLVATCKQPRYERQIENCRQPTLGNLTNKQLDTWCGHKNRVNLTSSFCGELPDKSRVDLISSVMIGAFLIIVLFCFACSQCSKKSRKESRTTKYSTDSDLIFRGASARHRRFQQSTIQQVSKSSSSRNRRPKAELSRMAAAVKASLIKNTRRSKNSRSKSAIFGKSKIRNRSSILKCSKATPFTAKSALQSVASSKCNNV